MKKTLFKNKIPLFSFLFLSFFTIVSNAQDIGWQWAKSGGGTNSTSSAESNNGSYTKDLEQILDIKTDADNNYYYLANITSGNSQIDGIPVTTYNTLNGNPNNNTDILLFSTTADGTYRWHRVIGGTNVENAWNIQLDNEGGIYVGANTFSAGSETSGRLPTRFSEADILPYVDASNTAPQYGYKTSFLLKYNTANGNLVWRKDIQGNVTSNKRQSYISQLQIDSSNTIHAVVALREGTHLDGQVIIPPSDNEEILYTYYLLKCDISGTLTEPPMLLPVEGGLVPSETFFRYDETLNRYYFAGSRRTHDGTTVLTDLSYNGLPFTQDGYILAIDAETLEELWRKEMITSNSAMILRNIRGIEIEDDSSIYLGGRFFNSSGITFNDYVLNNELTGYIPVIIKLDIDGNVLWHKIPDSQTDNFISTITLSGFDVAINDNEVAFATEGSYFVWGDFQIDRPVMGLSGHRTDPVLIRFNKQTGAVVGLNDVMGTFGFSDALTAVTVDNEGAYVVGGYMRGSLFTDNPNGVDAIASSNSYIDFFYAKLTVDTDAGIKDFNNINVNVYPNPTTDIINIETTETLLNFVVYDNLGRKVQNGFFDSSYNQINLQSQATGIYFVKVNTIQGNTATVKVVKK